MSSDEHDPPFSWQLRADLDWLLSAPSLEDQYPVSQPLESQITHLVDAWGGEFDVFNNEPVPSSGHSYHHTPPTLPAPRDSPTGHLLPSHMMFSGRQQLATIDDTQWLSNPPAQGHSAFGDQSPTHLPPQRTPMVSTAAASTLPDDTPLFPNPSTSRTPLHRLPERSATARRWERTMAANHPIGREVVRASEPAIPQEPHPRDLYGQDYGDFLHQHALGEGCIFFRNDAGELEAIKGLNMNVIGERCALLAAAFEYSRSGPQFFLEIATSISARPFCRFLYGGTYANNGSFGDDIYAEVPTSLLLHCELYRLGDVYDLADLRTQAYVNVLRQCEFGCSSPEQPIDLCKAIEYVYAHLRSHNNLIDAVLNYCASCFLRHDLANDAEFKTLAYNLRPFHQDLCKVAMKRPIEESDVASAIIQMPFKHVTADEMSGLADRRGAALLGEAVALALNGNDGNDQDVDLSPKKRKRAVVQSSENPEAGPSCCAESGALPLRLRQTVSSASDSDSVKGPEKNPEQRPDEGKSRKRRISTRKNETAPVAVPVDEPDYEVISGPESVEALSDSESETGGAAVEITQEGLELSQRTIRALPLRTRAEVTSELPTENAIDESEDSDWTAL